MTTEAISGSAVPPRKKKRLPVTGFRFTKGFPNYIRKAAKKHGMTQPRYIETLAALHGKQVVRGLIFTFHAKKLLEA